MLLVSSIDIIAQIGGKRSYEFLNVPVAARLAGLGGVNVSLADRDLSFVFSNPALVSDTLNGFASVNYQFYPGKVSHGSVSWRNNFNNIGPLTFGIQHLDYGSIDGFDDSGMATEDFNAGETAILVGRSHRLNHFALGINLKGIFSNLAGYRSSAIAVDIGGVFKHPHQQLTIGLAIRNAGFVLSEYSETSNSILPFDVQVGTTYKPPHMPLRFSVTAFNLTEKDVTYQGVFNEADRNPALQRVLTHFNFGGELILHKNFNLMFGYNYFNHRALKLENGGDGAGFSIGFAANVKNADFVFSRMGYVAGQAAYSFGLSYNLNKLLKRKTI